MLTVTISNIDCQFVGVFDTTDPDVAAKKAVDSLMAKKGFFEGQKPHKCDNPAGCGRGTENVYGIVLTEGDDAEEQMDAEDTYLIFINKFVPDQMF